MTPDKIVIYLDDLCIHSKSMNDHFDQLETMFTILRDAKLQIQASKTSFLMVG